LESTTSSLPTQSSSSSNGGGAATAAAPEAAAEAASSHRPPLPTDGTRCALPRTPSGDHKLLTAVFGSRQLLVVVLVIFKCLQELRDV